jgi:hypothetical protein
MAIGAEQYQGSVNIRFEEINNCGELLSDSVIPDCRTGQAEHARLVVMDSGFAANQVGCGRLGL